MENSSDTVPHEPTEKSLNGSQSRVDLRQVCEEQDKAREALLRKLGIVNVAVDLVRDGRDE